MGASGHGHGLPKGVASFIQLPDAEALDAWHHVFLEGQLTDSLLRRTIFTMRYRGRFSGMRSALQGMLLFVGLPGTGKSTTARALASRTAQALAEDGTSSLVCLDPHQMPSSSLGESQQNVRDLVGPVLAEFAARTDFVFVIVDEVEALAVRRSAASFETNPVDVHRATDALLEGLDQVLFLHPNVMLLMTTNFPDAIDEALLSRVDEVVYFSLPSQAQRAAILRDTLHEYATVWPELVAFAEDAQTLETIAAQCDGLSGRDVRKLVLSAVVQRDATVDDPGSLSAADFAGALAEHRHRNVA